MTLRDKRVAFSLAISRLLLWANDNLRGVGVAFGEGYVALTDGRDGDYDGPHKRTGGHYTGVAVDLVMWDDVTGRYITEGGHLAYRALGERWERMDSMARWGGRFGDDNHFSFEHEGVK